MSDAHHLVVVGSNPPTTSGQRTLRRVEVVREVLGFQTVEMANLFPFPTYRTSGLSDVGQTKEGWLEARHQMRAAIERASGVLLAYGLGQPTGAARHHHRMQVAWLDQLLVSEQVAVWWVGGQPRHPSRWHRHTHRVDPSRTWREVLPEVLTLRTSFPSDVSAPSDAMSVQRHRNLVAGGQLSSLACRQVLEAVAVGSTTVDGADGVELAGEGLVGAGDADVADGLPVGRPV